METLETILATIRTTFEVDFEPLQVDDSKLEVLTIKNMQNHLDGLLKRHAIRNPLKDLPLWAKIWPGSFVLGRLLRKYNPEGKSLLELGAGCGILGMVAASPVVILMEPAIYAGVNAGLVIAAVLLLGIGVFIALKLGGDPDPTAKTKV